MGGRARHLHHVRHEFDVGEHEARAARDFRRVGFEPEPLRDGGQQVGQVAGGLAVGHRLADHRLDVARIHGIGSTRRGSCKPALF